MKESNLFLIFARAGLGLLLLGCAVAGGFLYCHAANDKMLIASAFGTLVCFMTGIYFLNEALCRDLWHSVWTPKKPYVDDHDEIEATPDRPDSDAVRRLDDSKR